MGLRMKRSNLTKADSKIWIGVLLKSSPGWSTISGFSSSCYVVMISQKIDTITYSMVRTAKSSLRHQLAVHSNSPLFDDSSTRVFPTTNDSPDVEEDLGYPATPETIKSLQGDEKAASLYGILDKEVMVASRSLARSSKANAASYDKISTFPNDMKALGLSQAPVDSLSIEHETIQIETDIRRADFSSQLMKSIRYDFENLWPEKGVVGHKNYCGAKLSFKQQNDITLIRPFVRPESHQSQYLLERKGPYLSLVLQKDLFYGSISPNINSSLWFYSFLPPCKKCIYYTFMNKAPSDSTVTGVKVEGGRDYQIKYAAELVKSIWCLDAVTYSHICSFAYISLGVIRQ
ncbi:hypothetical protein I7I51_00443 [Histoplasma capsulatum]|uniref:Uncharacterized protein n=1 Tax=Ajellomyces capsulatus TaxID=5037 RepID=A0A8A1MC20_AJECA|nr:hypothetical protein I7I51_00443 [Histoplasma capsulatum]